MQRCWNRVVIEWTGVMSCNIISIWINVLLQISKSTFENTSAFLVISCWTSRLFSGLNSDKSMLSKTSCWCSIISLLSCLVSLLFFHFCPILVQTGLNYWNMLFRFSLYKFNVWKLLKSTYDCIHRQKCIMFWTVDDRNSETMVHTWFDRNWCLEFLIPLVVSFSLFRKALVLTLHWMLITLPAGTISLPTVP